MCSGLTAFGAMKKVGKLGPEYESMVDTVRGVGYMAVTPPHPEWIVNEPATLGPISTGAQA